MADKNDKRQIFRLTLILVVLILIGISVPLVRHYMFFVSTDDAYVDGTVVPVSAEVKGKVSKVFVEDHQLVRSGEPLLEVEPEDYLYSVRESQEALSGEKNSLVEIESVIKAKEMALQQAKAALDAAVIQESLASKEKNRYQKLVKEEAITQERYDRIESEEKVAKAKRQELEMAVSVAQADIETLEAQLKTKQSRIKGSEAEVALAGINLKRTVVKAPLDGRVAQKAVDPGKYVQPGQPLLAVVSEKDIWVTANFKETQIKKMQVGQPVLLKVDAYPGITFKGHLSSFQPGTGSTFSLLPAENATGNFIKIVQRVPVKILIDTPADQAHPLWPGLSVVPSVDMRKKR
jgi:membrane fusion protein (multidrug efflux system)